jgi:hypothetical protein
MRAARSAFRSEFRPPRRPGARGRARASLPQARPAQVSLGLSSAELRASARLAYSFLLHMVGWFAGEKRVLDCDAKCQAGQCIAVPGIAGQCHGIAAPGCGRGWSPIREHGRDSGAPESILVACMTWNVPVADQPRRAGRACHGPGQPLAASPGPRAGFGHQVPGSGRSIHVAE